jgi:hypothetical protein
VEPELDPHNRRWRVGHDHRHAERVEPSREAEVVADRVELFQGLGIEAASPEGGRELGQARHDGRSDMVDERRGVEY